MSLTVQYDRWVDAAVFGYTGWMNSMFWTFNENVTVEVGTYDIHDIVVIVISTCRKHMTIVNSRSITQELGSRTLSLGVQEIHQDPGFQNHVQATPLTHVIITS